jgi:hypothetical protein
MFVFFLVGLFFSFSMAKDWERIRFWDLPPYDRLWCLLVYFSYFAFSVLSS